MPFDPHLGISQRIENEAVRNDLKERMQTIASNLPGGFIIRTQAESATDEELQADCSYLRKLWQRISDRLKKQDRKSTRLNSSHVAISYAVFCLKKTKYNTKLI